MDQIQLISQIMGTATLVQLQEDANVWLRDNADKEIVDISIISHPAQPDVAPELGGVGWIIMIRYTALGEAGVNFAAP